MKIRPQQKLPSLNQTYVYHYSSFGTNFDTEIYCNKIENGRYWFNVRQNDKFFMITHCKEWQRFLITTKITKCDQIKDSVE